MEIYWNLELYRNMEIIGTKFKGQQLTKQAKTNRHKENSCSWKQPIEAQKKKMTKKKKKKNSTDRRRNEQALWLNWLIDWINDRLIDQRDEKMDCERKEGKENEGKGGREIEWITIRI